MGLDGSKVLLHPHSHTGMRSCVVTESTEPARVVVDDQKHQIAQRIEIERNI